MAETYRSDITPEQALSEQIERVLLTSSVAPKYIDRVLNPLQFSYLRPHLDPHADELNLMVRGVTEICFGEKGIPTDCEDDEPVRGTLTDFAQHLENLSHSNSGQANFYLKAASNLLLTGDLRGPISE
jgi:hypothetical protein